MLIGKSNSKYIRTGIFYKPNDVDNVCRENYIGKSITIVLGALWVLGLVLGAIFVELLCRQGKLL